MPPYSPTTWVEGVTKLGPTNMNKIEAGIVAALRADVATAKGDIYVATGAGVVVRKAAGADGRFLKADSAQTDGLIYALLTNADMPADVLLRTLADAKGDLLVATGADVVARLAAGSNGQFLVADSTQTTGLKWASGVGYGTSLPGSPGDTDEYILVDSTSAPTYAWRLRYNSTATKWDFIGGSSIYAEVVTKEAPGSLAAYVAVATAGPSIALPVAGDYLVEIGCAIDERGAISTGRMSYDIGATGAVDADAVIANAQSAAGGNASPYSLMRARKKTGLTAVTLTAKYKSTTATTDFQDRWMRVTPIRLG